MHSNIGTKIREARKKKGLRQSELAQAVNISTSAIGMYEQNRREPDYSTLSAIATVLELPIDHLIGHPTPAAAKERHGVRIPVYGSVAAGIPIEAVTDIGDYEEIPQELADAGEYVALRIKGRSMEPRMLEGDIVIVRVQPTIEDGEIAIVMVGEEEATCKKIKKTPQGIMLLSMNPVYEPMFYTNADIAGLPLRIFGKVIELRGKL
jgi:repressor LexA